MVSFGNASGPLDPINVQKDIQAKSLFLQDLLGVIISLIKKNYNLE